jgi:hypothetical protein
MLEEIDDLPAFILQCLAQSGDKVHQSQLFKVRK